MTGRLPDFVCIGGMRCGSTTLWEMLRRHRGIFLPETKELHYFDREGRRDGIDDEASYRACFAGAASGQVCGECTPSYLTRERVCDRMARLMPRVRLLVILRDPVKRAWSHYGLRVRQGRESRSFERAIRAERAEESDWVRAYIGWSRYAEHLGRFEEAFGRESLHVLFLEELVKEPARVLEGVWRHLGVPTDAEASREAPPKSNAMVMPRSVAMYSLTRRIATMERSPNPMLRVIGRVARSSCWRNLRAGDTRLPESAAGLLRELFYEDDLRLSAWLGRELPWAKST